MAYLLDTNIFIQAHRLHYGMDFCPAFWDWLERSNAAGQVFSIEKVSDELAEGKDQITEWAEKRGEKFFLPPDNAVLVAMQQVSQWIAGQSFTPAAVSTFFQVADFYLVAHALAHRHVVVTHEVPANSVNYVKIPNVCIGLGVKCVTPYEMLRKEKARFVLSGS